MAHETKFRRWSTFTPPQNTALAAFCGLFLLRRSYSIPDSEFESLLAGRTNRVFDAYVNIGSLETQVRVLIQRYPRAKYIVMDDADKSADRNNHAILTALEGASLLRLRRERTSTWRDLCEYLKLAPPNAQYPSVNDIGLRTCQRVPPGSKMVAAERRLRHDPSPWIAKLRMDWSGISASALEGRNRWGLCGCASKTILLKSSPRDGCYEMTPSLEISDFFVPLM